MMLKSMKDDALWLVIYTAFLLASFPFSVDNFKKKSQF